MSSTVEEQVYDILIQNYHLRLNHTKDCHKLASTIAAKLQETIEVNNELLETLDGTLQFIELMGMKVPEEFKRVVAKAKGENDV